MIKTKFLPSIFLLSLIIITSCTSTHYEKVKFIDSSYHYKVELKNPRKKPISNCNFQVYYIQNGQEKLIKSYKTDNSGYAEISINENIFNSEILIKIPKQEFDKSTNYILPYEFKGIDKENYYIKILIPYTKEFLKTKDTSTRLLLTRRVLLNTHPEWDNETRKKIESGNIEVGMEPDMVRAALGEPQNITRYFTGDSKQIWAFFVNPHRTVKVYFENGKVKKIERISKPMEPPPPVFGY